MSKAATQANAHNLLTQWKGARYPIVRDHSGQVYYHNVGQSATEAWNNKVGYEIWEQQIWKLVVPCSMVASLCGLALVVYSEVAIDDITNLIWFFAPVFVLDFFLAMVLLTVVCIKRFRTTRNQKALVFLWVANSLFHVCITATWGVLATVFYDEHTGFWWLMMILLVVILVIVLAGLLSLADWTRACMRAKKEATTSIKVMALSKMQPPPSSDDDMQRVGVEMANMGLAPPTQHRVGYGVSLLANLLTEKSKKMT